MSPLDPQTIVNLSRPLDQRRVKTREGGGGKSLSYIPSHDAIRTANAIFGYGEWGHVVEELVCIGVEPITNPKSGKQGNRVGYRCTVRLSVDGCHDTSGVGYGDAQEYNGSLITPHELAMKEAESDAVKRALKNYGDQFALILYAKPEDQGRINQQARIREQRAIEAAEAAEAATIPTTEFSHTNAPIPAATIPAAPTAVTETEGQVEGPAPVAESSTPAGTPERDGADETTASRDSSAVERDPRKVEAAGSSPAPGSPSIPDHALSFVLPDTVLEVVIDQIGTKAAFIAQTWPEQNAEGLVNRIREEDDPNLLQFFGHTEATTKHRKGVLAAVKARLDKLAASDQPNAGDTVSVAQGALATAMDAAAKAGHVVTVGSDVAAQQTEAAMERAAAGRESALAGPSLNQEMVELAGPGTQFYDKATGTSGRGPFTAPAPKPEVTPLMRLRALIAFVAKQPKAVEPGMVPHLSSEQGVLDAVKASAWGVYASLDEMPPDDVNAVWMMAPADTRAHIESLSFEDCAALSEESI